MSKKIINSANVSGLPISGAVVAGDFLFVSGMIGINESGEITEGGVAPETKHIFKDLKKILDESGYSIEDIVKVNVVITDRSHFDGFNEVYASYFTESFPSRVCFVSDLTIDASIEMDFIAYKGQ